MTGYDRATMERLRGRVAELIQNRTQLQLGHGPVGKLLCEGKTQEAHAAAIEMAQARGVLEGLKGVMSVLWEDIHGDECHAQEQEGSTE